MQLRQMRIAGWTINAAIMGAGRPILFLHGLGMSWQWWTLALTDLSDRYEVCAVDLPGSGGSSEMSVPDSEDAYRELVSGIIRSLDAGPCVVVGHSLGGYVAVRAAMAGAGGIAGLILVAPGGFGQVRNVWLRLLSFPIAGELAIRTGGMGSRIFVDSTVHNRSAMSPELRELAAPPIRERKEFLREVRLGMRLGRTTAAYLIRGPIRLSVPVQLVWGRHDSVLPVAIAFEAQEALGTGPPIIFERSGHVPQLEEPERFTSLVRAFCAQVWPH